MLEKLDKDASVLPTQQPTARVNQQETLAYLGGLFDGEGHFGVGRINPTKYKGTKYKAQISLSNTDPALINALTDVLRDQQIAYSISTRAGRLTHHLTQYMVSISALESQQRFLELIIPHLRGVKKAEANLAYKFVLSRIKRNQQEPVRHTDGTFVSNNKAPYTIEDEQLYGEYKRLRNPQRLHVLPPNGVKI